jgi:hypothetical protein
MMTLRVDGQGKLEGFRYFWLKYVRGFDASQHCARCLVGSYEKRVHPTMPLGTTLALNAGGAPFVYLCGVGPKYTDNLHLAWRPVAGVRAQARTYPGELVSVEGGEAMEIPALAPGFRGLPSSFTTCRNFRFGVAHLEDAGLPSAPR